MCAFSFAAETPLLQLDATGVTIADTDTAGNIPNQLDAPLNLTLVWSQQESSLKVSHGHVKRYNSP